MIDIVKASGETEEFSRDKLCRSLQRAGAPRAVVNKVCGLVEREIAKNATTEEIAKKTAKYLQEESLLLAAKYQLKKALMELGPAGFYFEEYVAAVLQEYGYKTTVGKIMRGHCVSHEIDILGEKEGVHHIMELKYHNRRGLKTDVKVAMYSYARFLDIAAAHKKFESKKHKAWVVTNTKFTTSAIKYGNCMDMELLGWHWPKQGSLEQLIEQKSLYPITVLPSANRHVREQFASQKLMFVRDLLHHSAQDLQKKFALNPAISKRLLAEAYSLV
ncbi:MAG TPA: ATP cone domain-containing protein [Candidatus Paceibacterota bacterium]